jgi:hypothetical protein
MAPNPVGDGFPIVGGHDQGVEGQSVVAHQSSDECASGRAHNDIRLIRIPSRGQADRHQGGHLVGRASYAASTEHQSYPAHPDTLNGFLRFSIAFPSFT